MNRDEFRKDLASAAGREKLGFQIDAEEAAGILADDVRLDALFAKHTQQSEDAAPTEAPENGQHQLIGRPSLWRNRATLIGGGVVVIAAVVIAATVGVVGLTSKDHGPAADSASNAEAAAKATEAAYAAADALNDGFTAEGTVRIHSSANNPCFYSVGLEDVQEGGEVVVSDASGKTLGIGQLSNPVHGGWGSCTLNWQVDNVPAGANFYGIEVGHRGVVKVTEQQLEGGAVNLTVG